MRHVHHRRGLIAALGVVASVPLILAAGGSSAHAADCSTEIGPSPYCGQVIANPDVNVRGAPSQLAVKLYTESGTTWMDCKVPGPAIRNNAIWYHLSSEGYASARYIKNGTKAPPWCGGEKYFTGKVISPATLAERTGPDTGNVQLRRLRHGQQVSIVCKVDGQLIQGNPRWYWIHHSGSGREGWSSARYIDNIGAAPPFCSEAG